MIIFRGGGASQPAGSLPAGRHHQHDLLQGRRGDSTSRASSPIKSFKGRVYQQGVIANMIIFRGGGARLPAGRHRQLDHLEDGGARLTAERHRQHCDDLVDPSGRAGSGSATMTRGHYHLIIASTATTRPMESLTTHHREDHRHAPSPRIPDKPQPYNLPRHALPLVVRHPLLLVVFPRRIHGLASLNTCGFTTVGRTSRPFPPVSPSIRCVVFAGLCRPRDLTLHINEEQIALPSPKATRG